MKIGTLQEISESIGLTIKIQVREVFGFSFFKIVVAQINKNSVKIWAEMKGWSFKNSEGLQLDTLRILKDSPNFVSELIWATTMSWALEKTKCKSARLLAIYDDDGYSKRLVRYFRIQGFNIVKEVGSSPSDLLLRLVWGGAGTLMKGDCLKILERLKSKLKKLDLPYPA